MFSRTPCSTVLISRCAARFSEMVLKKELKVGDITEDLVCSNLQSNHLLPDPSLVVRLGKLQRYVEMQ